MRIVSPSRPGITVTLESHQSLRAGKTFWLRDLDPESGAEGSDGYYRLCHWISSWLMSELPGRWAALRGPTSVLGTTDWKSYGWFRRGCELEAARDPDGARSAYSNALARDPFMRGAQVNLGRILSRQQEYSEARPLLEQASDEARGRLIDPTSYSAAYPHAVLLAREAAQSGSADDPRWDSSLAEAQDLMRRIEKGRWRFWNRPLLRYLQSIEPEAHGFYAVLALRRSHAEGIEWARKTLKPFYQAKVSHRPRWTPRGRYNIACALSRLVQHGALASPDEQTRAVGSALDLLKAALRADWYLRRNFLYLDGEGGPKGKKLKDDDLAYVYQEKQTELDRLMAHLVSDGARESEATLPLARLPSIGSHAAALHELGIRTPDELLFRLTHGPGRRQVAKQVGVSDDTAENWAALLELVSLDGMTLDHLVVVSHSEFRSRAALGTQSNAVAVSESLADVARALGLEAPELERVAKWVHLAQQPSFLQNY